METYDLPVLFTEEEQRKYAEWGGLAGSIGARDNCREKSDKIINLYSSPIGFRPA